MDEDYTHTLTLGPFNHVYVNISIEVIFFKKYVDKKTDIFANVYQLYNMYTYLILTCASKKICHANVQPFRVR